MKCVQALAMGTGMFGALFARQGGGRRRVILVPEPLLVRQRFLSCGGRKSAWNNNPMVMENGFGDTLAARLQYPYYQSRHPKPE